MFSYKSKRYVSTINDIVQLLERELPDVMYEIWLFGSLARGEGKATSDIDIMVNCKSYPTRELRFHLYDVMHDIFPDGDGFDLKFCVDGIINSGSDLFDREVNRDKVIIKTYK